MNEYRTSDDELITGEAVAIELPAATVAIRLGSALVDVFATYVLLMVLLIGLIFAASLFPDRDTEPLFGIAMVLSTALAYVAVPTLIATVTRGKSLGKWMFGLRVVRDDGGAISFHHAFVRALIGIVEVYTFLGAPALVAVLLSRNGKRLGDRAAGTYVVRDRVQLFLAPQRLMPPQLATWANTADVAPLPASLQVAVRQFLQRAVSLDPVTRDRMARQLADAIAPYAAPPPPPGTPAEAYLAAVSVVRRNADQDRLAREQSLRDKLINRSPTAADAG